MLVGGSSSFYFLVSYVAPSLFGIIVVVATLSPLQALRSPTFAVTMTKPYMPLSVASSAFQSRAASPSPTLNRLDQRQQRRSTNDTTSASLLKTVVVVGGSYAGAHAAEVLSRDLPSGWRVVLVERNSHFHHVYHFPRYSVVSAHAPKAFIPYTGLFRRTRTHGHSDAKSEVDDSVSLDESRSDDDMNDPDRHRIVQASVVSIGRQFIILDRPVSLTSGIEKSTTPLSVDHSVAGDDRDSGYGESLELESRLSALEVKGYGSSRRREWSGSAGSNRSLRLERVGEILRRGAEATKDDATTRIQWDFLVYALGSHPPPPLQLPRRSGAKKNLNDLTPEVDYAAKAGGVDFLTKQGAAIAKAQRIVVIGGGALGIQYATDIASHFSISVGTTKHVTLVHSRNTFLPLFLPGMNVAVQQRLRDLSIETKLGERVDLESVKNQLAEQERGERSEVEVKGIHGSILATGQRPNSGLMASFCPTCVPGGTNAQDHGSIKVLRSLQIAPSPFGPSPVVVDDVGQQQQVSTCDCVPPSTWTIKKDLSDVQKQSNVDSQLSVTLPSLRRFQQSVQPRMEVVDSSEDELWKRVFAIGDCADAFGAIKAGHTGWDQADIVTGNILKMIKAMQIHPNLDIKQFEVAQEGEDENLDQFKLTRYQATKPMMRLTLGVDRYICQLRNPLNPEELEVTEQMKKSADEGWSHMWRTLGMTDEDPLA